MLVWMMVGLALAGQPKPWDGKSSDIVVVKDVNKTPEQLVALFSDLSALQQFFPADCVDEWGLGEPTKGVGANGRLTYNMGAMHRRLTIRVTKVEGHMVELEHDGKRGFITQTSWKPGPGGLTHVTFGSYVKAPPWPFKPMYFNKIHPQWQDCYDRAIETL